MYIYVIVSIICNHVSSMYAYVYQDIYCMHAYKYCMHVPVCICLPSLDLGCASPETVSALAAAAAAVAPSIHTGRIRWLSSSRALFGAAAVAAVAVLTVLRKDCPAPPSRSSALCCWWRRSSEAIEDLSRLLVEKLKASTRGSTEPSTLLYHR